MQHKTYCKARVLDVRNSVLDITREAGEPTVIKYHIKIQHPNTNSEVI